MKGKFIITSSAVGLSTLIVLFFGLHTALLSHHPSLTMGLFYNGFALAFLATLLAAAGLPGHWRSGAIVGRLVWCFAVVAAYAAMLAFGP